MTRLQEVATTLAQALREQPPAGKPREPDELYMELASLVRYEHMSAESDNAQFEEALTRLENLVGMSPATLPAKAVRQQIAAAVHMVLQVSRMRDGQRRITAITEIVGMEGDIITTQDLFTFQFEGEGPDGKLQGSFKSSGLRPHFTTRAEYYGLDRALLEAVG